MCILHNVYILVGRWHLYLMYLNSFFILFSFSLSSHLPTSWSSCFYSVCNFVKYFFHPIFFLFSFWLSNVRSFLNSSGSLMTFYIFFICFEDVCNCSLSVLWWLLYNFCQIILTSLLSWNCPLFITFFLLRLKYSWLLWLESRCAHKTHKPTGGAFGR